MKLTHEDHDLPDPDCEQCLEAQREAAEEELAEIAYWDRENPGWAAELRRRR